MHPAGRVAERTNQGLAANLFLLYSAPNVLPGIRLSLVHRWIQGAQPPVSDDLSTWGGSVDVSWRFYLGRLTPYLFLGQEVSHTSTRMPEATGSAEAVRIRSWNPGLVLGVGTTLWNYLHLESGWTWLYSQSRQDFGVGGSTGYLIPLSLGFRF